MNTAKIFLSIGMIGIFAGEAMAAAPTIDTFNIQSYLRLSNNQPVNATSADFVFAVFKGTTCIWAKRYSAVAINTGVINQKISGNGTNIASISNASATPGECVANFSGTALDSTLLNTGSPAALSIRVYTETTIDTYKPIWDIPLNSAPTAMIADLANTATTASTANDLATAAKVSTSSGASDNGKFPVLSGNGQIDNSMINQTGLSIANTQVSGLGTAATVNTGTTAGTIPVLGAGGRLTGTMLPTFTANKIMTTDGSGVLTPSYSATSTSSGASDSGKVPLLNGSGKLDATMVDMDPANLTNIVAVDKGGTGVASLNAGEIVLGNGTSGVTTTPTLPVTKGGTGVATITANGLVVGAGTGNVTTIAPSTSGNVLYSNGTVWLSGTKATAGIVDTSTTQTVAGAKTFSTSIRVGASGGTFTGIFKCAAATVAAGGTDTTATCTGATATSVVHCSPAANLPAGWSLSYSRGSAANQITLRVDQASGATGWTSTAFNCIAYN